MPSNNPKQIRITIRIFESDFLYLKKIAQQSGYNILIRGIVHKVVKQLKEKESVVLSNTDIGEVEL